MNATETRLFRFRVNGSNTSDRTTCVSTEAERSQQLTTNAVSSREDPQDGTSLNLRSERPVGSSGSLDEDGGGDFRVGDLHDSSTLAGPI